MRPRCLVVTRAHALNDPPAYATAASLATAGFAVTIVQGPPYGSVRAQCPPGVEERQWRSPEPLTARGPVERVLGWLRFRAAVRAAIADVRPDLLVTFMHHPLAALPAQRNFALAACIYDIPSHPDTGRLDRLVMRRAWRRLREADVVWASDRYKASLTRQFARLPGEPLVCHNCPPLGWVPRFGPARDVWLRDELRRQGASLGPSGGCIVLRAGAVGLHGGIEETLEALVALPEDYVFLMMGRPVPEYAAWVREGIQKRGLSRRAFLWESPSDEIWKQALLGADVGHLVHGPFPPGAARRTYQLNSSLSNNRLYQYLAAGLPVLTYDDPRLADLVREVACFRTVRLEHLRTDVTDALRDLGCDTELRVRLGDAARRGYESRYNWDAQFSGVLAAITAAIARGVR